MEGQAMTFIDLDGHEVSQEWFDKGSRMLDVFHEFCQLWARKDDFPGGVFEAKLEANVDYPDDGQEHHYWGFRLSVDDHEVNMGYSMIYLYVATSDELHGFDLVGYWEEGELVYLTSRVDTSWSEVWVNEYPYGEIKTRPDGPGVEWKRYGRFPNAPKED